MKQKQDMRFGVIRDASVESKTVYILDGEYCPECHKPTEVGEDSSRRYCINKKCNALILEDNVYG